MMISRPIDSTIECGQDVAPQLSADISKGLQIQVQKKVGTAKNPQSQRASHPFDASTRRFVPWLYAQFGLRGSPSESPFRLFELKGRICRLALQYELETDSKTFPVELLR